MRENITSVLFDMDGVLIDSQPMHYEADIRTLARFGVRVTVKDVEKYAGTTNVDRYTRFKRDYQIGEEVARMVAFREKVILDLVRSENVGPINGIPELLKDIRDKNLKTAVASSSSYELIAVVLDKLGLKLYFDQVVSGEDMKNGKPAPDIFLKTAEVLGSAPSQCVVVEDSGNGVKAGIAAGMKVVGYINPSSGTQDLSGTSLVIQSFREIDAKKLIAL